MSWLATAGIAFLSGVVALLLTGVIANACVSWYRISSFEGKSGYFVVFTAIVGGIAGAVIGVMTCHFVAAGVSPSALKGLGLSLGVIAGIAGVAALICWRLADIPPKIEGLALDLEVEIRLPVGEINAPASAAGTPKFRLGSVINHRQRASENGELNVGASRRENGRWIIPASVFLFTGRGLRSIDAQLGDSSIAGFIVPLPARPGKRFESWSDWGPQPRDGKPWPDTNTSYRFRIARRIPPSATS